MFASANSAKEKSRHPAMISPAQWTDRTPHRTSGETQAPHSLPALCRANDHSTYHLWLSGLRSFTP
jgi:hypothetical protein